jgi:hypothetical protein
LQQTLHILEAVPESHAGRLFDHVHPGYYGAYVLDPDGTNVEAVYRGPARRSTASVVFSWDE